MTKTVMPAVVQHPSPNYSRTLISHDLFVLHDQEGFTLPSVAWLCNPQANASAHLCQSEDGKTVYQLVPLEYKAWAQCAFNGRAISLEMPGFAAKGFADDLLRSAALIAAWCCRAYSIPLVWAQQGKGRGLCCHHDLGAAGGGHSDVGPIGGDTWTRFINFVRAADVDLGPTLPPFALAGAPGPHEVAVLPNTTPAASHGGAPRNEPSDAHVHPTPSGFAPHTIAALQSDLNALGEALPPLIIDGWMGDKTRLAIKAFQAKRGLKMVDGMVGPETWAALDKAMWA